MAGRAHEGAFDRTVLFEREPEAQVPDDPFIGVALGQTYVVRKVLGEGAMGRLYEATHVRIDRKFAVKVLHRELCRREDLRQRFEREARVMGRVRSDHVVDVVDVIGAPDGRTCIVTELLHGEDLEGHIAARGGKLPVQDAVFLARQCLWGLGAAHGLSVIHRDIKPGNLFLARDSAGRVTLKLLDFGIAKWGGDAEMTAASMVMGTPAYMAPEQARGASRADLRSDLYAVGAVLYRMLAGRSPYTEEDVQTTLVRLLEEAPPRLSALAPHVPLGLVAVIEQAMARDPAQRFASADELDAALSVFDSGPSPALRSGPALTSSAGTPGAAQRATLWARLVRPFALCTLITLSFAVSATTLLASAATTRSWSTTAELGFPERVLSGVVGGLTFALCAFHGARALRGAYANAADVAALSVRWRHSLAVLGVVLGLCAVGSLGIRVMAGSPDFSLSPSTAIACFVALAAALTTLTLPRFR